MTTFRSPLLRTARLLVLFGIAAALNYGCTGQAARGEVLVSTGDRIAFMGDSITYFGWQKPAGYVHLVDVGLGSAGIRVVPVPCGIGGNTSDDMLGRLDADVISKKPNWMFLSCGVNDVMHGQFGVPLARYETNIAAMVERCRAAGIKVVLFTSTPIGESDNPNNQLLAQYNDFLRQFAAKSGCPIVDESAAIQTALKMKTGANNYLTVDGVHMNWRGDQVMATAILATLGLSPAQIETARTKWDEIPEGWATPVDYRDPASVTPQGQQPRILRAMPGVTVNDYFALTKIAAGIHADANTIVVALFLADVKTLFKPQGKYANFDAIFDAGDQAAVQDQLRAQVEQQLHDVVRRGTYP